MTNEPVDFLILWRQEDIGTLDEVAFEAAAPTKNDDDFTVSFWFRAASFTARQVLVNVGNRKSTQLGWSVFLHECRIKMRANFSTQYNLETTAPILDPGKWHHFAGIVDPETDTLGAYLDGRSVGWELGEPDEQLAPGAEDDHGRLVIGGYTDTAGGHFDYTFGRNGTGLVDDFRLYKRTLSRSEIASLSDEQNRPSGIGSLVHPGTMVDSGVAKAALPNTPVFVNGEEGYACYRIPAIVRAANGDLLAFAEGRLADCSDSTSVIRLVCKRSRENGLNWEPLQTVARNFFDGGEHACMNPSPVVDTVHGTGRIVVVFNKSESSEWDVVQGIGLDRVCCVFSDDNGYTWTDDIDITRQVHRPYMPSYANIYPDAARPENQEADWRKHAVLPGHAIQLQAVCRGRILYTGCYTTGDDPVFETRNYLFWSDDLGRSWQMGSSIATREDGSNAKGLNEAMAVELESGAIMVNSRNYQGGKIVGRRAVTIGTFDATGDIHFQPARHDPVLADSGIQASIIRYPHRKKGDQGKDRLLLFSNPDHPRARVNLTLRLSYDEGRTWPVSRIIDPGPSAYSDMVIQDDMKIGLLYERGNQGGIVYTNCTVEWLEGEDFSDRDDA
jgi:sialidase-1